MTRDHDDSTINIVLVLLLLLLLGGRQPQYVPAHLLPLLAPKRLAPPSRSLL